MSDDFDIEAMRAALEKATPGPWGIYRARNGALLGIGDGEGGGITDARFGLWREGPERDCNASLIALAPAMAAEIERLRARVAELEAVAAFYRDAWQHNSDGGGEPWNTREWKEPTSALWDDAGRMAYRALAPQARITPPRDWPETDAPLGEHEV